MFSWPHFYLPCCFLHFHELLFSLVCLLMALSFSSVSFLISVRLDFISYYFAILPTFLHFFIWGLFHQRNCFSGLSFFVCVMTRTLTFVICSLKTFFRQVLFMGWCAWPRSSMCYFS